MLTLMSLAVLVSYVWIFFVWALLAVFLTGLLNQLLSITDIPISQNFCHRVLLEFVVLIIPPVRKKYLILPLTVSKRFHE
jgi:hypothetical protein